MDVVNKSDINVRARYPNGWALDAENADRFAALERVAVASDIAFVSLAEAPSTENARIAANVLDSLREAIYALSTRLPLDLA